MVNSEHTSVKTIRLAKSLEKSLEREAKSRSMSLNSFVSSVLTKYDEWDRLAEKFGMMSIPPDEIIAMLENLSDAQIEKTAKKCGESIPKAVMDFWFSKTSPEAFLKYLTLRMTYQRLVNNEVLSGAEGQLVLIARHEHGRKWSVWTCNYLVQAIYANFGVEAKFEINGNTFRIECPRLTKIES